MRKMAEDTETGMQCQQNLDRWKVYGAVTTEGAEWRKLRANYVGRASQRLADECPEPSKFRNGMCTKAKMPSKVSVGCG